MQGYPTRSADGSIKGGELGLIHLAARDIFAHTHRGLDREGKRTEFTVRASYLEIYKEAVTDLLGCAGGGEDGSLKIRMDPNSLSGRDLHVQGLTEWDVTSVEDFGRILEVGARRRTVAGTHMNEASSRSHAVLTLTIDQRPHLANGEMGPRKRSKVHLIDLAGSERASPTTPSSRLNEGIHINTSLLALSQVITSLSTVPPSSHIPYRDSKLTYLLSDSLGGNALTLVVACVNPHPACFEETVGTLRFAERARRVVCRARVNVDEKAVRLLALETELATLRALLESCTCRSKLPPITHDASTATLMPCETHPLSPDDPECTSAGHARSTSSVVDTKRGRRTWWSLRRVFRVGGCGGCGRGEVIETFAVKENEEEKDNKAAPDEKE
ncbi:Kinesin-like protein kif1b [Borealophlyctis nickersoniae]|nr:Kinesin-like protein kif1b [Borealophlyctis nickersoniae]